MLSKQEFFNETYKRIVAQGKPAIAWDIEEEKHRCLYRAPDGCKCAAGQWITDDEYDPNFEGSGIAAIMHELPDGHILQEYHELANALQGAHDRAALLDRVEGSFLEEYESRMRELAREQGLEFPEELSHGP